MAVSQFEAKTFGVGELITQRKLFRVPSHQRSYAWEKESIDEFLGDIQRAHAEGFKDYFIGLVVIQSSSDGEWILLDGQQRLTTVSLIYAAMRAWLQAAGFADDANQINLEYLGVRRLGGGYSSRMLLNRENEHIFSRAVTAEISDQGLRDEGRLLANTPSNKLLLDAALVCRKWIRELFDQSSGEASALYELSRFLDSRLKVVVVEVSSEVDAYVLFEALNDRGVALSAQDLIKNYILSSLPTGELAWNSFREVLGHIKSDDFLKVFWTSRYGLIQKAQIFKSVKDRYSSPRLVEILLTELNSDARAFRALLDDKHDYWLRFGDEVRDLVYILSIFEAKQTRSLLIAVFRVFYNSPELSQVLWVILVAIVRFQVIGRGRTGVVEKVFGRLCQSLSDGVVSDFPTFRLGILELLVDDTSFQADFVRAKDLKRARIACLLAADTAYDEQPLKFLDISRIREIFDTTYPTPIFRSAEDSLSDWVGSIGNYCLSGSIPEEVIDAAEPEKRLAQIEVLANVVTNRSAVMSRKASSIWAVEYFRATF